MLSIDEAIAQEREMAEKNRQAMNFESEDNIDDDIKVNFLNCATKHEQFAEWLEELKKRRSEDYGYLADIHQSIGYRKAVDDFAEKLLSQQIVDKSVVRRVKEQLKAGDNNGT